MTPMSATFEEMLEAYCYAICTVGPGGKSVEAAKADLLKYDADLRARISEMEATNPPIRADHPVIEAED